jgi:hypothetical protein
MIAAVVDDFTLVLSPSALQEIQEVLALPHLRKLHHLSDDEMRLFCLGLELNVNTRVLSGTLWHPHVGKRPGLHENGRLGCHQLQQCWRIRPALPLVSRTT